MLLGFAMLRLSPAIRPIRRGVGQWMLEGTYWNPPSRNNRRPAAVQMPCPLKSLLIYLYSTIPSTSCQIHPQSIQARRLGIKQGQSSPSALGASAPEAPSCGWIEHANSRKFGGQGWVFVALSKLEPGQFPRPAEPGR